MNPIFMKLGPINIYWYSIFILISLIIGGFLVQKEAKKHNIDQDLLVDLVFYTVPIAIICARIYYVIFNLDFYVMNPMEIFYIWHGGLAIHGAIIGGLLFLYYYCKKKKLSLLLITDIIVISLFLGQALGRWGNFMNSEAFGPVTDLLQLKNLMIPDFVIEGMKIDGVYHFPTFYFESIGCLIGCIGLLIYRRKKNVRLGNITSIYFIWYGIIRFFIESLRMDSLMLGNFKIAQIISIIMIVIGVIIWYYARRLDRNYHEEVYNGQQII